jgi:hypothetical protein
MITAHVAVDLAVVTKVLIFVFNNSQRPPHTEVRIHTKLRLAPFSIGTRRGKELTVLNLPLFSFLALSTYTLTY